MHAAVVVGCGGVGCRAVGRLREDFDIPTLTINVSDADINMVPDGGDVSTGFKGDREEAYYHAMFNHDGEIVGKIGGYSAVIGVTSLGGGTGSGAIIALAQCARSLNVPFISVVNIPWKFESDRRELAFAELAEVQKVSDRAFVMDIESANEMGGAPLNMSCFLEGTELLMEHATAKIAWLVETTPFLSLMSSRCYTYTYGSGNSILSSVEQALAFPLYSTDPVGKKTIICPDAPIPELEREMIIGAVTDRTGVCPEFVQGDMGEGPGAFIFLPISCRSSDSS